MYSNKKITQIIEPREDYIVIYKDTDRPGEYYAVKCPLIAVVTFTDDEPEAEGDPYQDIVGLDFNIDGWHISADASNYIETVPLRNLKEYMVGYVAYIEKPYPHDSESRKAAMAEAEKDWDEGRIKVAIQ